MSGINNTKNELSTEPSPDLRDPQLGGQFFVDGQPIGSIISIEPIRTLIPDPNLKPYTYFSILCIDAAGSVIDTRQLDAIRSVLLKQFNGIEVPRALLVSIDQQNRHEDGIVNPSYGVSGICQVGLDVLVQEAITNARLPYM